MLFIQAADGTNRDVMEVVKVNQKAIGYISDQRYLGDFVIGSTTQNISKLYSDIADDYYEQRLKGGNKLYGMKDDITDLTGISSTVDKQFIDKLEEGIRTYKATNVLPNKTTATVQQ